MIKVSDNLYLEKILISDSDSLFNLMKEIYPLAYHHFWEDKGDWYVNSQYSNENILKELSQENADYYFVVFNKERIGNMRVVWDEKLIGLSENKQVKLHRIYLHQKTQGNGLGKLLMNWLEQKAIKEKYHLIWLDAMNEQPQAFQFYKKLGYIYHSHTFLPFKIMFDEVKKMSQVYKKLK